MKRKRAFEKIIIGIMLLTMVFSCCGCVKKATAVGLVSVALGISTEGGIIEEKVDTHGGFHNDGMTFIKISFEDKAFAKQAAVSEHWNALPMTGNLATILWGDGYTSFFANEKGEPYVPEVKEGLYYFYDRHKESTDKYSYEDIMDRYSFNFDAAIYDAENNVLYFVQLDT